MYTVHAKNASIALENQILLPKSLVYWYFLFPSLPLLASALACVLNITRNEWWDNCEMHWYLMNLTLQGEKTNMFVLTSHPLFCSRRFMSQQLPCQVAWCAVLISSASMAAAVGRREALEAAIRHGFLRFTSLQVRVWLAILAS